MKLKRCISLMLAFVLLCLTSACGKDNYVAEKIDFDIDEKVMSHFSDLITLGDIFADVREVDLNHKMNTKGLTKVTSKNTADITYKDKSGNIVYVENHTAFGKRFEYHTKSVSGRNLVAVFFTYESDSYVRIECDDFKIEYDNLNSESKYGADSIIVDIYGKTNGHLQDVLYVMYSEGRWFSHAAFFTDENGFNLYYGWLDGDKYDCSTELRYPNLKEKPECDGEILTDEALTIKPEFSTGFHKFSSYTENGKETWYLTADFVLTFETQSERDAFMKAHDLSETMAQGNEDPTLTVRTGKITVAVAADCEEFDMLLKSFESEDSYYRSVTLNEKGEINSIGSDVLYSYD